MHHRLMRNLWHHLIWLFFCQNGGHSYRQEYAQLSYFKGNVVRLNYMGVPYDFLLTSKTDLLDSSGFHKLITSDNGTQYSTKSALRNSYCTFFGEGIQNKENQISLFGCDDNLRGMVITENSDFIFIEPNPNLYLNINESHLVYKREALLNKRGQLVTGKTEHDCLLDLSREPLVKVSLNENDNANQWSTDFMTLLKGPLYVELAVFADQEMWKKFKKQYGEEKAEKEMENYVLAILNNINLIYNQKSIDPKVIFKLKRYEVLKVSPFSLQGIAHNSGDVDLFLTNFCEYQKALNPPDDSDARHWDHAVMLTGYDLHRGKQILAAGYAPVKGMCSEDYSCTIAEGGDFSTVYTIAHEIGHSLGMLHDGQNNGCSAQCCIMSYISGVGKTTWSNCSVREFNRFVDRLGTGNNAANCLLDGRDLKTQYDTSVNGGILPGQRYTADMQCKIAHGDCNKMELREGYGRESICEMLYCGDGDGYIRSAEPALDGTYCGGAKWCFDGECKAWNGLIRPGPVNGGWTQWNDAPSNECGGGDCSKCEIKGQLRIRRSVRLCENPSPDNGGQRCSGSAFRGVVCDQNRCEGISENDYANKNCSELKNSDIVSAKMSLSGKGMQQKDDPCKVWCQTTNDANFYWTVNNFPDGTPCGTDKHCMKGECLTLACDSKNLVKSSGDCPNKNDIIANVPFSSHWMPWSSWSTCSKTCGRGARNRLRSCKGKFCFGLTYETAYCETSSCPSTAPVIKAPSNKTPLATAGNNKGASTPTWSTWSPCSQSCGSGQQTRRMNCQGCQGQIQTRSCGGRLPCRKN